MQSDDNMPPSLDLEAYRIGQGPMNSDSLPVTISRTVACVAGRHEGKRTQNAMIQNMPQTLPNTRALRENDPAAGPA